MRLDITLSRERPVEYQVDAEYMVLPESPRGPIPKEQLGDGLKANFLMTVLAAVTNDERKGLVPRLVVL